VYVDNATSRSPPPRGRASAGDQICDRCDLVTAASSLHPCKGSETRTVDPFRLQSLMDLVPKITPCLVDAGVQKAPAAASRRRSCGSAVQAAKAPGAVSIRRRLARPSCSLADAMPSRYPVAWGGRRVDSADAARVRANNSRFTKPTNPDTSKSLRHKADRELDLSRRSDIHIRDGGRSALSA